MKDGGGIGCGMGGLAGAMKPLVLVPWLMGPGGGWRGAKGGGGFMVVGAHGLRTDYANRIRRQKRVLVVERREDSCGVWLVQLPC